MPMPNFHSCRVVSPGRFQEGRFRVIVRGKGKDRIQIVIGRKHGETKTSTQAVRYPIDVWDEGRARTHCKKLGGRFEPKSKKSGEFISYEA